MRRAGVKSQNSHRPFPCTVCTFKHPNKNVVGCKQKPPHRKTRSHLPNSGSTPNVHLSLCAANQPGRAPFLTASTSSTCSAGQTRGLNSLCHSANLLGSWSAMPLDPCASVQRHLSTRADWQRLTRRSGPGATAQTKLVRLGRGPLVLNPSVGRRFSVPRSVAVSVGEVGVFGVVACVIRPCCSSCMPYGARVGFKICPTCITLQQQSKLQSLHPSIHLCCACLCETMQVEKGGE